MAYELKQQLKLTQGLVMTPQLQLAVRLLQMSRLELVETVREELETNPVLEEAAPAEAREAAEATQDTGEMDWQNYLEGSADYPGPSVNFSERPDEEDDRFRNIPSGARGLSEHLIEQLHVLEPGQREAALGEFIIGNIDEDGYLRVLERGDLDDETYERAVIEEISRCTGVEPSVVESVLCLVQGFDPPGVGARTPRECLLVQARLLPDRNPLVDRIIWEHLGDLAAGRIRAIARALGAGEEDVREAARFINSRLNPAPGSGFGSTVVRHIVPDVFIKKVGDEYVVILNDDGMPKLRISRFYRDLLTGKTAVEAGARGYLKERMKSAMWLIKSIHQRQKTIYRVVECIVKFQKDFLDRGVKYLRPLALKDVAAELGVHESTVSRVTANKYADTPRGLFELKYFFTGRMSSTDGGETTAEYIKEKLREIIENEDAARPLSDQEIVRILAASGIKLARRTVAKYREALGFQSSSRRKARF